MAYKPKKGLILSLSRLDADLWSGNKTDISLYWKIWR